MITANIKEYFNKEDDNAAMIRADVAVHNKIRSTNVVNKLKQQQRKKSLAREKWIVRDSITSEENVDCGYVFNSSEVKSNQHLPGNQSVKDSRTRMNQPNKNLAKQVQRGNKEFRCKKCGKKYT